MRSWVRVPGRLGGVRRAPVPLLPGPRGDGDRGAARVSPPRRAARERQLARGAGVPLRQRHEPQNHRDLHRRHGRGDRCVCVYVCVRVCVLGGFVGWAKSGTNLPETSKMFSCWSSRRFLGMHISVTCWGGVHPDVIQEEGFLLSDGFSGSGRLSPPEGEMVWADGTRMPTPTDAWHVWFSGEPDNAAGRQHCTVMTNYRFWEVRKGIADQYYWIDYGCDVNAQEIQGYTCERESLV